MISMFQKYPCITDGLKIFGNPVKLKSAFQYFLKFLFVNLYFRNKVNKKVKTFFVNMLLILSIV